MEQEVKGMRLSHFLAQTPNNTTTEPVRIFVATWNVGGKAPTAELNLDDFLPPDDHSDIYVLGFQEIVPLNAGNVLVIEDNEPAARWLVLINQALNRPAETNANVFQNEPSPSVDSSVSRASSSLDTSFSDLAKTSSSSTIFQKSNLKSIRKSFMPVHRKRLKACNCPVEMAKSSYRDACFGCPKAYAYEIDSSEEDEREEKKGQSRDSNGSVRSEVISPPTARDELKYNLIAWMHISEHDTAPDKLLFHLQPFGFSKVIWFGDLNYRIALSYADTKNFLMENNWDALFERDQLKIERDAGRVFKGWNEGKIFFAPTYKYSYNSDAYASETATSNKKRRTPAWCDRILWRGDGILQLSYYRGESRFSDHRPVCGTFIVEVEVLNRKAKMRPSNANMKIGAEELLPQGNNKGKGTTLLAHMP
uniref:Inositol polyphosphate-related phosphatase domain-containing protein n=1 Tax=Oryza nivara TaxID=4536 RepID=A0A0E0FUV0_ORYNI